MMIATSKTELVEQVVARAPSEQRALAVELASLFVDEASFMHFPQAPPGALSALIGRFAIRKDDVNLFNRFLVGFGLAYADGVLPDSASIVSVGLLVLTTLRDLAANGAWLDEDRTRILTILRANVTNPSDPGLTAEAILAIVRRTTPELDLAWVNQRLAELERVPLQGGGAKDLAMSDPNGAWRPLV